MGDSIPVRLRLIPYNARLIDARKSKGLTQVGLAQLAGIKSSYLGHIETLRAIPSQDVMNEICSALELSQDYLFPPSLLEAIKEGLFGRRLAELEEKQIINLNKGRRAGLLPAGIIQNEVVEASEREFDQGLLKERILDLLDTIPDREREVLELRYGLKDGISRTLEEVSQYFMNKYTGRHLTRDRIRQIEAKALRHLRHPSRSRRLKDYLD